MPNNKITELVNLPANKIQNADLTVVVDVTSPSSPTGETKNMNMGDVAQFVNKTAPGYGKTLYSASAQVNLGGAYGITPVIHGGTGTSSLPNGVLVGNNTSSITSLVGEHPGQVLAQTAFGPAFIDGVVSSSAQVCFLSMSCVPEGLVSSSLSGLFSSSAQVSFIGERDTPAAYVPNAVLVTNPTANAVTFVTSSDSVTPIGDQIFGGKCFANGTYYYNGDLRERMYANPNAYTLYSGSNSGYFESFIHSGNICYDAVNSNIYFVRGTYPRRQGASSNDLQGKTWRESNPVGVSAAEAICRTRDDGQNFEVILNLYTSAFTSSLVNSVQDISGSYVVSEPSAVAFDPATNYLYFSCRNDHNNSCVYRITVSGSSTDIVASGILYARMHSNDLKIDALDLVTIPKNFHGTSVPNANQQMLMIGVSPDYVSYTNTTTNKNAALFMTPTATPPGQFQTDYPQAYTLHKFWASSFNSALPSMAYTGVKGIKTLIARRGGGEWNPLTDVPADVDQSNSRIYVVSSGAVSNIPESSSTPFNDVYTTSSILSSQPPVSWSQSSFDGPATAPELPVNYPITFNNNQFGGHAVLELLVGDVAGQNLTADFSSADDSNRSYKTWRSGVLLQYNTTQTVLNLGFDDPGQVIGTLGSGTGVARNTQFAVGDRLFISTSPVLPSDFNGQTPYGTNGCRGIVKITANNCATVGNGTYLLNGGDGVTGLTQVMIIPVLASTIDTDIGSMEQGGLQGLQQIVIDPINNMFYVADCFYSRFSTIELTSSVAPGFSGQLPYSGGGPYDPYHPGGIPITASVTTTIYQIISSDVGAIYEGSLFAYSRETNGQRIFDNNNPDIAYSAPVGLTGYNTGPANAFRLIYTNAENNFTLLQNNLWFGNYINGLSRTFAQDGVLAQGKNIFSIGDAGPGSHGGLVVRFTMPCETSDYSLLAFSDNNASLGSSQDRAPDLTAADQLPTDLANVVQNSTYYTAKNKSYCRITYNTGSIPNVVYFACFAN